MRKELDALSTTDKVNGAQAWTLMYILVETEKRDLFQKDIEENYDIRPPLFYLNLNLIFYSIWVIQ